MKDAMLDEDCDPACQLPWLPETSGGAACRARRLRGIGRAARPCSRISNKSPLVRVEDDELRRACAGPLRGGRPGRGASGAFRRSTTRSRVHVAGLGPAARGWPPAQGQRRSPDPARDAGGAAALRDLLFAVLPELSRRRTGAEHAWPPAIPTSDTSPSTVRCFRARSRSAR